MQRLIQDKIKRQLAEMILFGALAKGGGVLQVTVENDELALAVEEEVPA